MTTESGERSPASVRLRRSTHEARIEVFPLIDVIFLVLTFFIYAMVLMIPAKVVPMRLSELEAGMQGQALPAITISIDSRGQLFLDREPITRDALVGSVREKMQATPNAVVYIATADDGEIDRLPTFIDIYGRLSQEGLDIRLVGRPQER
ncbi:MAG: ExbD/TolR family protein [Phycisphaerales bacterium]